MNGNKLSCIDDISEICQPGAKLKTKLELPEAQGCRPILPVMIVRGKEDGPKMVILAAQHGRELHGPIGIARVFEALDPAEMNGTLVMLPILNPLAMRMRQQDYPCEYNRYRPAQTTDWNMNRTWGQNINSYSGVITSFVGEGFVKNADIVIDLHGWGSASTAWSDNRELLLAFGVEISLLYQDFSTSHPGMLDGYASRNGVKAMLVELAPQNQLDPEVVKIAERGILNVLREEKMLSGKLELPARQYLCGCGEETVLATDSDGIVEPMVKLGDYVSKGQLLARQWSLDDLEIINEFVAPHDGPVAVIGGQTIGEDTPPSCVFCAGQNVAVVRRCKEIISN
jgi:predicted deacylase